MPKNYICTAKGFYKGKNFNTETLETTLEFTDKVREAHPFNTSTAVKFMTNHDIEGFVWKPYEQEPIRDSYTIRRKDTGYDFRMKDNEKVNEWKPVRLHMVHDSDASFLTTKKIKSDDAMSYEEAKTKAVQLNLDMIKELNDKVLSLAKSEESTL